MHDRELGSPDAPLSSTEVTAKHAAVTDAAHKSLHELEEKFEQQQTRQTLGQWARGAQERMAKQRCITTVQRAQGSLSSLPQTMQGRWTGRMNLLTTLATRKIATTENRQERTEGDPIAILRFIANTQPELTLLKGITQRSRNPLAVRAALNIDDAFRSYEQAIGQGHPDVYVGRAYNLTRNPDIDGQGRQLIQMAVFTGAAIGAIFTGVLAMFAKPDDKNWKLPAFWLLLAGIAAGWGDITMNGTERMDKQTGFLTKLGGQWQGLQERYGMRGANWAAFARNWYANGSTHRAVLRRNKPLSVAERDAILALAPTSIHQQLKNMLASRRGDVLAADFKLMTGLLKNATSGDAQGIVISYIGSGSDHTSMRAISAAAGASVGAGALAAAPTTGPGLSPTGPVAGPVVSSTVPPAGPGSGPGPVVLPVSTTTISSAPPTGVSATTAPPAGASVSSAPPVIELPEVIYKRAQETWQGLLKLMQTGGRYQETLASLNALLMRIHPDDRLYFFYEIGLFTGINTYDSGDRRLTITRTPGDGIQLVIVETLTPEGEKKKKEAEDRARKDAEDKMKKDAEDKARKDAEDKIRKDAEDKARKAEADKESARLRKLEEERERAAKLELERKEKEEKAAESKRHLELLNTQPDVIRTELNRYSGRLETVEQIQSFFLQPSTIALRENFQKIWNQCLEDDSFLYLNSGYALDSLSTRLRDGLRHVHPERFFFLHSGEFLSFSATLNIRSLSSIEQTRELEGLFKTSNALPGQVFYLSLFRRTQNDELFNVHVSDPHESWRFVSNPDIFTAPLPVIESDGRIKGLTRANITNLVDYFARTSRMLSAPREAARTYHDKKLNLCRMSIHLGGMPGTFCVLLTSSPPYSDDALTLIESALRRDLPSVSLERPMRVSDRYPHTIRLWNISPEQVQQVAALLESITPVRGFPEGESLQPGRRRIVRLQPPTLRVMLNGVQLGISPGTRIENHGTTLTRTAEGFEIQVSDSALYLNHTLEIDSPPLSGLPRVSTSVSIRLSETPPARLHLPPPPQENRSQRGTDVPSPDTVHFFLTPDSRSDHQIAQSAALVLRSSGEEHRKAVRSLIEAIYHQWQGASIALRTHSLWELRPNESGEMNTPRNRVIMQIYGRMDHISQLYNVLISGNEVQINTAVRLYLARPPVTPL